MYLITYDTTLYYFTFHISKIDLRIRITFFIQNDFSNKLTINMWTIHAFVDFYLEHSYNI